MKNSASPIRGILVTIIFLLFFGISNINAQSSSFTISTATQQCLTGNSFSFVNSSIGAGNTYLWNFGDGTNSTATNPSKVYSAAGSFSVELITTNGSISYFSSQQVIVNPMPVADFATYVNTGNGSSYTFQSTSTIQSGNMNYSWTLGANSSPSTSTVNSPQTTYSVGGTKNVQLTVTSDAGCTNTIIKTINVVIAGGGGGGGVAPTAAISLTSGTTPQCLTGNSFDFDATSVTGSPTFYQWDFPNASPNVSYLANPPAVTFSTAGTYDVKLFVQNAFGTNTYTYTVVVNAIPATPTITSPTTVGCNGGGVTLTSSSASGNQWYRGVTALGTSNTQVASVAGSYTVQVTANGCTSLASNAIVLTTGTNPTTPTITAGSTICAGANTVLSLTSSGTGLTYQWNLGGIPISGETNTTYTASAAGTYTITVTNASGCPATSVTSVISLTALPATPTIAGTLSFCAGGSTNLTSSAAASYQWYKDGVLIIGAINQVYAATAAGTYTVKVTSGCTSLSSLGAIVTVNPAPVASFSSSNTSGSNYTFYNGSYISNSAALTYAWTFVNGVNPASPTSSTLQNPVVVLGNGTTVASLTVTSAAGCVSNVATQNIVIGGGGGSGSGPYSIDAVAAECLSTNSFDFALTGSGVITVYSWSFPGATPSTSAIAAPTGIVFNSAGTKTVTLNYTIGATTYTATQTVVVNPNPVASFSSSNTSGNSYTFYNGSYISNSAALTYLWSGNNGVVFNNTTAQNPTAVLGTGTTAVTLTVTSNGCSSSTTQNIVVNAPATAAPVATITLASAATQCITGNSYTFGVNSTGGAITTYQWSIPNATVTNGTTATPTAVFTQPGTYNITLTVSNASGSMSTQYSSVTVLALPTVSFYYSNASNVYTFTPSAWVSNGSISSSQWAVTGATTLSPAATPTPQNLVATLNVGANSVTLTVSTGAGCSASYSQTITVAATAIAPVAGITLSVGTQTQCLNGNSYTFTNNVTGGTPTSYQWYFQNGTPSSSTAANPGAITFSQAGTHTVQLYVSNSAGNSTATYNVTINAAAQPTVSAAGATYFCSGGSVTLTSSAAASYQWYNGITPLGTASTQVATTSGVYTVVVTYANGCTSVASFGTTVTVVAAPTQPTISAGGATTFCAGGNVVLTSSTGNSYQWYLNAVAISGATGSTYTATTAGAYTVTVTNANGCSSIASAATTVTVNPAAATPTITAGGATTFCSGVVSYVVLSSSSAINNQWYKNGILIPGATSQTFNADSSGSYRVILTGACNSALSNAISVTVNPSPVASYVLYLNTALTPTGAADTTKKCFVPGDDFSYQSSSTIASGTMSYLWNFGTNAITFRDGTTVSYINPRMIFDTAGTYPVKLKITSDKGCVDSVIRMVYLSKPVATFSPSVTYSPDIYANPTVNVNNASYDYGGILTYSWSTTATPSITLSGANPSIYTYNSGGVKNINLTVTSNAGCTSSVSHSVNIVITPKARVSVKTSVVSVPNPMGVGSTANYKSYTITGISNPNTLEQSSVVTGSIVSSLVEIDYYRISTNTTVTNWVSQAGSPFTDVVFSISEANQADYIFTIRLYVTSNLGITNMTSMTILNDLKTGGHTYSRGLGNTPIVSTPILENVVLKNISVYPNPARDFTKVNVKVPENVSSVTVRIYSMNGKLVAQQRQDRITNSSINQNFTLNVNNLSSGTYTVVVVDDKGRIIGNSKMIKAMY